MPATSEVALTKTDSNTLTLTSVSPLASITNENGATSSLIVPKSSTTYQVANTYTSAHATTILTKTTIHSSSNEEQSESASNIVLSLADPNIASSSIIKSSSTIASSTGHTPFATTTDQLSTQFPSSITLSLSSELKTAPPFTSQLISSTLAISIQSSTKPAALSSSFTSSSSPGSSTVLSTTTFSYISDLPSSTSTSGASPSCIPQTDACNPGTSFNSGQATYNQIYYGCGYTESYNNPGNDFLVPITQQFPSTQNACTALTNCMQFSLNQAYSTIDLHLVQNVDTTTVWECVAFWDPVGSGNYFTVQNSTILVGYGYDFAGG